MQHPATLLPAVRPAHTTDRGALYASDALELLPTLPAESVDLIFADPPFNLGKRYRAGTQDQKSEAEYEAWCRRWMTECVRVLAPGGALYVYHLPRWLMRLGRVLQDEGLTFRHWIAILQTNSYPIRGRLYPAHYGLLYLTKGAPKRFARIRTPVPQCRHCGGDLHDYGGKRATLHPQGLALKDIWTDIRTVRQGRYKPAGRDANALSTRIADRVLSISSLPGDLVLDPFAGSGTILDRAEHAGRRWLGIEIDYCPEIIGRLTVAPVAAHPNDDFVSPET